jgi:hypothetical protein
MDDRNSKSNYWMYELLYIIIRKTVLGVVTTDVRQKILYIPYTVIINSLALALNAGSYLQKTGIYGGLHNSRCVNVMLGILSITPCIM